MRRALIVALGLTLAAPAAAQDLEQTLADMRQELAVLHVELQRLERELSTTGAPTTPAPGGTTLERLDALEAQLRDLTQSTERMQNRIARVVEDGTRRVGDLEFRICELEPGCDIGEIGETLPIGGEGAVVSAAPAPQPSEQPGGAQLAVGEQADFDRARAAYDDRDFQRAAELFSTFVETYPGSPLSGEAHFLRGEALAETGDVAGAARAYLDSFSGAPEGRYAPRALLQLGLTLDELGQAQDACATLGEVPARFPESDASLEAQTAMAELGCS